MSDRGKIRIITRQGLANIAAQRWHDRCSNYCGSGTWMNRRAERTYNALLALGPAPLPADVDKAIGNNCWTQYTCDCCDESKSIVVAFEGPNSDEYGESYLCAECMSEMQKALNA